MRVPGAGTDARLRVLALQVVEVHGDFDAAIDLDHDEAYRAVMCLRREQ